MPTKASICLSFDKVQSIDLSVSADYIKWNPQHTTFLLEEAGKEPYKLLAYISKQLPPGSQVSDIGTLYGCSALAFASNPHVQVNTFDVQSDIPIINGVKSVLYLPNVKMTVVSAQAILPKLAYSDIISLDINTIDGNEEIKIIKKLIEYGFKGVLILDDIFLSPVMENVWRSVPSHLKKIDVTQLGHWSGTGLVIYDESYIDVKIV